MVLILNIPKKNIKIINYKIQHFCGDKEISWEKNKKTRLLYLTM